MEQSSLESQSRDCAKTPILTVSTSDSSVVVVVVEAVVDTQGRRLDVNKFPIFSCCGWNLARILSAIWIGFLAAAAAAAALSFSSSSIRIAGCHHDGCDYWQPRSLLLGICMVEARSVHDETNKHIHKHIHKHTREQ